MDYYLLDNRPGGERTADHQLSMAPKMGRGILVFVLGLGLLVIVPNRVFASLEFSPIQLDLEAGEGGIIQVTASPSPDSQSCPLVGNPPGSGIDVSFTNEESCAVGSPVILNLSVVTQVTTPPGIYPMHVLECTAPEAPPETCSTPASGPSIHVVAADEDPADTGDDSSATTVIAPPQSNASQLEKALYERLQSTDVLGGFSFDVPAEVTEGDKEQIEAVIDTSLAGLFEKPIKLGTQPIPLLTTITIDVRGDGVEVRPLNDPEKVLGSGDLAPWRWSLVAQASGVAELSFTVAVLLEAKAANYRAKSEYPVRLGVRADFLYRIKSWIADNWQWLSATIIIPGMGLLIRWRKRGSKAVA
jgi:hypothetical protein